MDHEWPCTIKVLKSLKNTNWGNQIWCLPTLYSLQLFRRPIIPKPKHWKNKKYSHSWYIICYSILPAVMLSPSAITTLMSCGRSSDTFSADLESGGSWGQEKFTCPLLRPSITERIFLFIMYILTRTQSSNPNPIPMYILTYEVTWWDNATDTSSGWCSTHRWVHRTIALSPQFGTSSTTKVPAKWKSTHTTPRTPTKPARVALHEDKINVF